MNNAADPAADRAALMARIADLEGRLAFQDDTIDQLNRVVVDQDQRIARLELSLRRTREQVELLLPLMHASPGEEPPPPHY
ncbi:MAG: SlyX family protein [Pseudomonadota bacterium]